MTPNSRETDVRRSYNELIAGQHSAGARGNVSFLVSTSDVSAGRGDLYVALGLGRALSEIGYGVSLVPKEHWYNASELGDIVVAMLPQYDVRLLPAGRTAIAWVRNETENWIKVGALALFDKVAASSELSRAALQKHVPGPVSLLAIGVDSDLFTGSQGRRPVSATTTAHHWGSDRDVHRALRLAPRNTGIRWYGISRSTDRLVNRWNRGHISYFDLPGRYRRSLLVVDDLNHTTKPFGNHNSRLFESLAAGSLPIVNTALGLAELGLSELPVYKSPEDLLAHIRRLTSNRQQTAELVQRLRTVVLEKHTFAKRAHEFAEMTNGLVPNSRPWSNTIGFFPDYRATNPFQSMMYEQANAHGYRVLPVVDPTAHPVPRDDGSDLNGYVLHIHWANPLLQSEVDPVRALDRFNRLKANIRDMRRRGGRLVWTIHNAMPHEFHHYTLELEVCRFLSTEADLIHVMGESTFEATKNYYVLPPEKSVVIPHASYVGVYPDFIDKSSARKRLGLRDGEIVLLCMGGIRPYKGLDSLLRAFGTLSADDPRLRLLISGNPGRTTNVLELKDSIAKNNRIASKLEFIPDSELQVWLRAADIAVLPYKAILNSGSYHLAMTFGLPIVAPRLGQMATDAVRPYVSDYAPDSDSDLAEAIRHAVRTMQRPEVSNAAVTDARSFTPADVSDAFFSALGGVKGSYDSRDLSDDLHW